MKIKIKKSILAFWYIYSAGAATTAMLVYLVLTEIPNINWLAVAIGVIAIALNIYPGLKLISSD